jgi:hypothetical protein
MTETHEGIQVTRQEFAKDARGFLDQVAPGRSVTVVDDDGTPRMRLAIPPSDPLLDDDEDF